jgi:hypothetical protein
MGVPFAAYGAEIYINGLAGEPPARLEAAARSALDDGPFGYVAGGAGGGATMRANRAAFDRYAMVPRMLRDTTERDWSTTLLGTEMPAPLLLAPIGVMSIVHPDGELAVARAAAELGVPMGCRPRRRTRSRRSRPRPATLRAGTSCTGPPRTRSP